MITEVIKKWGFSTDLTEASTQIRERLNVRFTRNMTTDGLIYYNDDVFVISETMNTNWRKYANLASMGSSVVSLPDVMGGVMVYSRDMGEAAEDILYLTQVAEKSANTEPQGETA